MSRKRPFRKAREPKNGMGLDSHGASPRFVPVKVYTLGEGGMYKHTKGYKGEGRLTLMNIEHPHILNDPKC